jgi:hypothetical protein
MLSTKNWKRTFSRTILATSSASKPKDLKQVGAEQPGQGLPMPVPLLPLRTLRAFRSRCVRYNRS